MILNFAYGALTLYDSAVPNGFRYRYSYLHKSYYPGSKMDPVWATPLSLAATHGIDFSFCSSGFAGDALPSQGAVGSQVCSNFVVFFFLFPAWGFLPLWCVRGRLPLLQSQG